MSPSKSIIKIFTSSLVLWMVLGCSSTPKYPIHQDVLLHSNIQIRIPEPHLFKSEDEFVSDVLYGLDHLFDDDLAKQKSVQFIRNRYKRELQKPIDHYKLFERALYDSFTNYGSYMSLRTEAQAAFAKISNISTKESGGYGNTVITVESAALAGGYQNIGKINFSLDFIKKTSGGTTTFEIVNVSYAIECVSTKNNSPQSYCTSISDVQVDAAALHRVLKSVKPVAVHLPSVSDLRKELELNRRDRYYAASSIHHPNTIKRYYPVDFAIAKELIGTELGFFVYDPKKSAFVHEKEYFDSARESKSVTHKYLLTVSPSKNQTIVEMSGKYNVFRDSYGGADKYGHEEFETEMSRYMALLDEILK
jgi:hypothetical protein